MKTIIRSSGKSPPQATRKRVQEESRIALRRRSAGAARQLCRRVPNAALGVPPQHRGFRRLASNEVKSADLERARPYTIGTGVFRSALG